MISTTIENIRVDLDSETAIGRKPARIQIFEKGRLLFELMVHVIEEEKINGTKQQVTRIINRKIKISPKESVQQKE